MSARRSVLRGRVAVVVSVALLALGFFGGLRLRHGPAVVIDFTESIEHARVYPLERDEAVTHPERVELAFPAGGMFVTEEAEKVTIKRNFSDPSLIYYVRVEFPWTDLDNAVAQARRFSDTWRITDSNLDEWYAEKQREGPTDRLHDTGSGGRYVEGTERSGKRLLVGFTIDDSPRLDPPYRLVVEFDWVPIESSDAPGG